MAFFPKRRLSSALAVGALALVATTARAADPTVAECLASSEASLKLRSEHKLRDARTQLLTCAASSCPADIRTECSRRIDLLNAAIPTIVFEAKTPAGDDLTAVKVTMDGQPLMDRLDGTPIALDPGEHKFVFAIAGQAPVTKTLVLREGERRRRERIVMGGAPTIEPPPAASATVTPPPPPVDPPPPAGPDPGKTPPPDTTVEDHSTRRVVGFVVGGLGVASTVVAVVEFLAAKSRDNDSKTAAASNDGDVQATTHSLHEDALHAQTFGIVFGVAGVVALGTGLVLILSSGGESAEPAKAATRERFWVRPNVTARSGALDVGVTW